MAYAAKLEKLQSEYDSLYVDTLQKYKLLQKAQKQVEALKDSNQIDFLQLKRERRDIIIEDKGWAMTRFEQDIEKGWKPFIVPSDQIEVITDLMCSEQQDEQNADDSDFEEIPSAIVRKRRSEPEPVRPDIEEAKRLLHIMSKNHKLYWPFEEPVDPEKLNVPDYFQVVKHPMDLSTIQRRLRDGLYNGKSYEFVQDVRLVFSNATLYNHPSNMIYQMAIQGSNLFEKKLDKAKYLVPPLPAGISRIKK